MILPAPSTGAHHCWALVHWHQTGYMEGFSSTLVFVFDGSLSHVCFILCAMLSVGDTAEAQMTHCPHFSMEFCVGNKVPHKFLIQFGVHLAKRTILKLVSKDAD